MQRKKIDATAVNEGSGEGSASTLVSIASIVRVSFMMNGRPKRAERGTPIINVARLGVAAVKARWICHASLSFSR